MSPEAEGNTSPRPSRPGGDGGRLNTKPTGWLSSYTETEFCAPFEKLPEPSPPGKTASVSKNSPEVWPSYTSTPTGTPIFVKMTCKPDTTLRNCESGTVRTTRDETSHTDKCLHSDTSLEASFPAVVPRLSRHKSTGGAR